MTHAPSPGPLFDHPRENAAPAAPAAIPRRNLAASEARRDEAMERAADGASEEWAHAVTEAIRLTARTREDFIADDIWENLAPELRDVREPRAIGPVIKRAAVQGIIEAVLGVYRKSTLPRRHARPLQVWRRPAKTA